MIRERVDLKDSQKIFQRFYSDRQENIKNHTGLGLSIAKEIIEHLNGNIILDKSNKSDYPGVFFDNFTYKTINKTKITKINNLNLHKKQDLKMSQDYKVKDMELAEWGLKEIAIARQKCLD